MITNYNGKTWIGEFLQNRTYAAVKDDGTKETKTETINRTRDMHIKKFPHLEHQIRNMFEAVHQGKVVPSMRSLQFGGSAIERANARMYNCAAAALTSWRDFHDGFYLLMCGSGFGYSVKKSHISQLPPVPLEGENESEVVISISDDKEGWAESLVDLFNDPWVEFSYEFIRPKGSLISSGGTASGPEALIKTHEAMRSILQSASGRQLTPLECHDIMCHIADGVVVGGVRRAALICLFDVDDQEMLDCKKGEWYIHNSQRARANNSAVIYRKGANSDEEIELVLNNMLVSGSGEPGISLSNDPNMLFNPCVTGDTPILTRSGYVPIEELVGQEVDVWNGFEFSTVTPEITGRDQKILEVSFSNGRTLKCTPYHKFHLSRGYKGETEIVEAKDLKLGEKLIKCDFPVLEKGLDDCTTAMYTRGFHAADGNTDSNALRLYDDKMDLLPYLSVKGNGKVFTNNLGSTKYMNTRVTCQLFGKSFVPLEYNLKSRLAWFAGLLDGDGCELVEGGTQVSSVNEVFLQDVQLMLQTCGVDSKIVLRQKEGYRRLPDGNGGYKEYWCQEAKALCVSAYQIQKLKRLGMQTHRLSFDKSPNRDASRFVRVTGVKELSGTENYVYCFNEPKRHLGIFNGIITGQCHEIALKDGGLCNLTEINLKFCKDLADIEYAVRAAVEIGTLQASYTDFPVLQPKWTINARDEALLGVSATGQADNWGLWKEFLETTDIGKLVKGVNAKMSKEIGINLAARITTTKPSGSTSAWLGCCSGIHADHAPYYVRHIRMEKDHPIVAALTTSNYPFVEVDKMDSDKMVVGFPVKAGEGAILKSDESAVELLERAKLVYEKWIKAGHRSGANTHNVSLTVEYKSGEEDAIKEWMVRNKESYAGISFLPRIDSVYEQMPFQEITKEEYDSMVGQITSPIDYNTVDWTGSVDQRMGELACANGACEIE